MYHEARLLASRKPRPARPRSTPQAPIDAIVQAAYRKFARGKGARAAMDQCLAEDRRNAKRKEAP